MDVDSQPTMEETILVGDDLLMGPPSPVIPQEITSHVLEGVELCDGILRTLFLCLQINDIEPFCQDELALYRQCAEKRAELESFKMEYANARLECNTADERANILASEVIGLEEKALRLRSNELKLERQLENSQAEISSFKNMHYFVSKQSTGC
ncbi:hypothetical protein ES319_D03G103500v1 [Gossypium barbadense]|uniref:DUF7803 domain-containing protein n=2 Tax=Gossypium TaxID=3633 RepID=A0A5J5S2Z4_GOSBA|nr:hypothetical protein ES319_D03G103500v1 [Gossypium barbadense]TYG76394.1 hypothetical protein ES288_D03G112100v1 [Gossypium darwinii]KAB2037820.1 hypothetical protein ES319_D03G103500v1 [Gossypium barbadense]KAB2037821.1 hypothetical protein ES319_D03G103500v1 [Gossypium barbadense]TYG76401.1 hypothetical protein ES288_D03G112100v1 [Gossypium darwinii]